MDPGERTRLTSDKRLPLDPIPETVEEITGRAGAARAPGYDEENEVGRCVRAQDGAKGAENEKNRGRGQADRHTLFQAAIFARRSSDVKSGPPHHNTHS